MLYTARLKHWVQSENNVHVKDAQIRVMLKTNSLKTMLRHLCFKPRCSTIVVLRSVLSSVLVSAILDFVLVTSLVVIACVNIEVRNL